MTPSCDVIRVAFMDTHPSVMWCGSSLQEDVCVFEQWWAETEEPATSWVPAAEPNISEQNSRPGVPAVST